MLDQLLSKLMQLLMMGNSLEYRALDGITTFELALTVFKTLVTQLRSDTTQIRAADLTHLDESRLEEIECMLKEQVG